MARPRFFIDQPHVHQVFAADTDAFLRSDSEAYRHIVQVLRLGAGKSVELVQRGVWVTWLCTITSIDDEQVTLRVIEALESRELPFQTTLVLGFSKGDTNEKVVRQATELGVKRIIPVLLERSISRPDAKRAKTKVERLRKIAASAAQQAHRSDLPVIEDLQSFAATVQMVEGLEADLIVVPWEEEGDHPLSACIKNTDLDSSSQATHVVVVIGPEGGISLDEITALRDIGARSVSLGPTILRVDTAACTALAIVHDVLLQERAPERIVTSLEGGTETGA
ncbi:MAG: 16S rRNA (uracil(1498)-N(3))-methyltransferase [Coriobacteriia bacterium]|nr:16S rRNA (uracil(1498)-N(3))-methyltransferase [Coriobacteriia bacterium]